MGMRSSVTGQTIITLVMTGSLMWTAVAAAPTRHLGDGPARPT